MSKNKKGKVVPFQPISLERYIVENGRKLALHSCWVLQDDNDDDEMGMKQFVVARQKKNGQIIAGMYLIDGHCLGLKDTFFLQFENNDEFEDFLKESRNHYEGLQYKPAAKDYVFNFIYGSIEFAEDIGFMPHKDFRITEYLLDDIETVPYIEMEFGGEDGKPLYITGPYDSKAKQMKILNTLEKNLGKDGFHYILNIDDELSDDDDDDTEDILALYEEELDQLDEKEDIGEIISANLEKIKTDNEKYLYSLFVVITTTLSDEYEDEDEFDKLREEYRNNREAILNKIYQKIPKSEDYKDDLDDTKTFYFTIIPLAIQNYLRFGFNYVALSYFIEALQFKNKDEENIHFFEFLIPNILKVKGIILTISFEILKQKYKDKGFAELSATEKNELYDTILSLYLKKIKPFNEMIDIFLQRLWHEFNTEIINKQIIEETLYEASEA